FVGGTEGLRRIGHRLEPQIAKDRLVADDGLAYRKTIGVSAARQRQLSNSGQARKHRLPGLIRSEPMAFNTSMNRSDVEGEMLIGSPRQIHVAESCGGIVFVQDDVRELFGG